VKILPIARDGSITLKATATFTTKSFDLGKYRVSVGLTHALLHLDHPSFDRESDYQATLDQKQWSQNSKSRESTSLSGGIKARIGASVGKFFGLDVKGEAAKEKQDSAEQKANVPYPIVRATPKGWQIGTELGDPRSPAGALPDGLETCLNGEYLSGRNGEEGDGHKIKDGEFALCVLKPNHHGNDPHITASLFGVSGSLKVSATSSEVAEKAASPLQRHNETKSQEDTLRRAFIDICVQRAAAERAQTGGMLTGEFYLSRHEILAPKLAPQETAEVELKGIKNDQTTTKPRG
jgi:hypothetical protein